MIYLFYFEYSCRIYKNPVANSEVSWNIYNFLRKKVSVRQKRIGDECPEEVGPDDLLTGMIGPRWAKTTRTDKTYPIMPWPGLSGYWYDKWFDDPGVIDGFERAKKIIALCGVHQYNLTKDDPKLSRWFPKLVRVDQGIDRAMFPLIKRKFNPPGERKFYYFGLHTGAKGDDMTVLAANRFGYKVFMTADMHHSTNIVPLGYVGNSDSKTWTMLAEEADFLIQPARCDCSPMNVLEAMSRGFIPIITPAAALPVEGPFHIGFPELGNVERAMEVCQNMPTKELYARQAQCLKAIDDYYNMPRFMNDVWSVIKEDVC